MNITKEIKHIMQEKGVTTTALNNKLNYKNGTNYTPQNLSKRLNKEDIKFGDALEILDVLGYTIKVKEKSPEGIELENSIFDTNKTLNKSKVISNKAKISDELDSYIEDLIKLMVTKYLKNNFSEIFDNLLKKEMFELFDDKNKK